MPTMLLLGSHPRAVHSLVVYSMRALREAQQPILPPPDIQRKRKSRADLVDATPSQKSSRIANQQMAGLMADQQAQVVLTKRIGLTTKDLPLCQEAIGKIKEMFLKELYQNEIEAW